MTAEPQLAEDDKKKRNKQTGKLERSGEWRVVR